MKELVEKIVQNVEKVMVGKTDEIRLILAAFIAEGHVLVEDVPGVGKTTLAKAISKSIGCGFSRIQFTPDLLPSDIVGINVYNQKTMEFEFKPGPIHNQIILADEINRTTPKTQAALLECMEERQVTIDGHTYVLPRPFLVIATENNLMDEGTFALPESELDRFFLRVKIGYPSHEAESELVKRQQHEHPVKSLEQVITVDDIINLQNKSKEIFVDDSLRDYIVKIVQRTREIESLHLGSSPRGSIALFRASQAEALLNGREFVTPDDIKKMAIPTLEHRISSGYDTYAKACSEKIIKSIIEEIPVPQ